MSIFKKEGNKAKRYVIATLSIFFFVLILMALIVYIWDPYNYYRIKNNQLKYTASSYINAGIIKNADYDTAIIGSSVSQNFDMSVFRRLLGFNPVKINTGGISLEQRDLFYNALEAEGRTDRYFIEISVSKFNSEPDDLKDTPVYLYDDSTLNDYKYWYGYETWYRAIPVSGAFGVLKTLGINIKSMHNLESVDNVGDWYNRKKVGRDIILKDYLSGNADISEQNTEGMQDRMFKNIDEHLTSVIDEDNEYIFYFPPYSALYWAKPEKNGYDEIWYQAEQYMMEKLLEYPNVKVYFFQADECTRNLDNYKDVTHYGKNLNDYMVECFANGTDQVHKGEEARAIESLRESVKIFKENNKELYQ